MHSKADEITRSIELSLAIGINKKLRKNNNKLISSEEMVRAKVREGSPRGSETTGGGVVGFVKKIATSIVYVYNECLAWYDVLLNPHITQV